MQYPQYDRQSHHLPLDDAELQAFDDLLRELPVDGAMNLEGVDGYLTALLLAPPAWLDGLPTADWLPAIWGGDGPQGAEGPPFASGKQRKRAVLMTLRHLQAIAIALRGHARAPAGAGWQPLFSEVQAEGRGGASWVDAADWCAGFLQAMDLAPELWRAWQDDEDLGPTLHVIALLGGDLDPEPGSDLAHALDDPEGRDALAAEVAEGVLAMHARRQAQPGAA